jgi:hypothetical protein
VTRPGTYPLVAALTVIIAAGPPGAAASQSGADPMACAPWKGAPLTDLPGAALTDVAVTSRTNAWAVGLYAGPAAPPILHWDGAAWTQQQAQLPHGELYAVSATSASDAWAVGVRDPVTPMTVHWNGSRWKVISTPVPGSYNYLYGVDAVAVDDAWTVGDYRDQQGYIHPLAMHWDGSNWKVVSVPEAPLGGNVFYAVDAVATDDVWAVGYRESGPFQTQPLIDHWDGTAWTIVPLTPPVGTLNQLFGVSGTAANDVWAVGFYSDGANFVIPLVEHWDGTSWTQVSVPSLPERDELFDVTAISATDAWAVGVRISNSYQRPFSLHWDGSTWTPVSMPYPGITAALGSVDASSSSNVWAGGTFSGPGSSSGPLLEHSKGCS